MAKNKAPGGKVKLVYRKSRTSTKIVIVTAIVLSLLAMAAVTLAIHITQLKTEQLRLEAAGLERENNRLLEYIEEYGTIEGIIRIAREELGLIEPDSIVIQPE